MKKLRHILAAALLLSGSGTLAGANYCTIEGIQYLYNTTEGTCRVRSYTADLPTEAVVHTEITVDEAVYSATAVGYNGLHYVSTTAPGISDNHLKTLTFFSGPSDVSVEELAIAGWTALRSVDFSENITSLCRGALHELPALEHIWLRSPRVVDFDPDSSNDWELGSEPILHVPAELLDQYIRLSEDPTTEAGRFLSCMSSIVSIDEGGPEDPEAALLTVRYEDVMLILHDTNEGHRIRFSSEGGHGIEWLHLNDEDHTDRLTEAGEYTVPALTAPGTLHIKLGE